MTDRELMQQVLEAMEEINKLSVGENAICLPAEIDTAMDALRERLAQPEMEPCAGRNCGSTNPNLHSAECFEDYEKSTGMNQWQGLTEKEINNSYSFWVVDQQDVFGFGKSLETKLKRKNT